MHKPKPPYDLETIARAMTEPDKKGRINKHLIEEFVSEAADNTSLDLLNPIQVITLHSIIKCNDKFKLSPLVITNFFNYQLSNTGAIKPIKTKAWDKSREQIRIIRKKFDEMLQQVGQKYYKDLK